MIFAVPFSPSNQNVDWYLARVPTQLFVWNCGEPEYPDDSVEANVDENLKRSSNSGGHFHFGASIVYNNTKRTLTRNNLNFLLELRSLNFQIINKTVKEDRTLLKHQVMLSLVPPSPGMTILR